MFASIFNTIIVQPLFNLLVFIYGVIPGHNFGLSIILFTVVIRLLMGPLIKKQLYQAKMMRELQPELKRIKAATKGNRQQESLMVMELYKERGISPFSSMGVLIVQFIILIGLYSGLRRIVDNPEAIITHSYSWLHNLPGLKALIADIHNFDATLFGVVDLTRGALNPGGGFYYPALFIVLSSAVAQFYQGKQLMPQAEDSRGLRKILKEANDGKKAEQAEVNAAIGRGTRYFLPLFIIFFTISLASALSLYWLVGGLVAFIQQSIILKRDETELEAIADKSVDGVIEGEVIEKPTPTKTKKKPTKKTNSKKRRK